MDTSSIVWLDPADNATRDSSCLPIGRGFSSARGRPRFGRFNRAWNRIAETLYPAHTLRSPAIIGTHSILEKALAESDRYHGRFLPPLVVPLSDLEVTDSAISIVDRLDSLMTYSGIDDLIVALPLPPGCDTESVIRRMIDLGAPVSLFDSQGLQRRRTATNYRPATEDSRLSRLRRGVERLAKSIIDRGGAAVLLTVLAPLLLTMGLLIRLTSKGPALFVQPRLGRDNLAIPVVKFRTMYIDRGDPTGSRRTVPNDPRVTPLGRFLRRWSVDELPQLFNVLAGHMSLVGPRPHAVLMKAGERLYFEAVPGYLTRHQVKPGITGWAQVNRLSGQVDCVASGHNRLVHDLHYIEHWSIWLDLKILLKTVGLFFDRVNRY